MGHRISRTRYLGLYYPEPVFRARQEIDKLDVGQVLELIADDPTEEKDIVRLVENYRAKTFRNK